MDLKEYGENEHDSKHSPISENDTVLLRLFYNEVLADDVKIPFELLSEDYKVFVWYGMSFKYWKVANSAVPNSSVGNFINKIRNIIKW